MFLKDYENKGLTGLTNLGNTCFVNSCLQILSHTYELNDFLNKMNFKKFIKKNICSLLLLEWINLKNLMWSENCTISPVKFINIIHKVAKIKNNDLFCDYSQNDVSEFLNFLINSFHESISREVNMNIIGNAKNETDELALKSFEIIKKMYSNDYSEIWNMFYGIHISQLISLNTEEIIKSSPEPFFIIHLPIPLNNKNPKLDECFDLYVESEILEGENMVLNEKTNKKETMKKKIVFWSLPNILVIDIKRFNHQNKKNQILIDFPINNLNLSKYVIGYNKTNNIYDLYGISNHSGSSLGGHYSSFIKTANDKWYHFNDTNVTEILQLDKLITPKAYCFFYRKKTIE